MSTVPRVAAEWMVFHLPSRSGMDWIVDHLEKTGVGILSVKELKRLGEILYSMPAVIEDDSIRGDRRLPSSAKKQRRVDFLRKAVFQDYPCCTIVNDRLLRYMQMQMEMETTTSRGGSASTLIAAASAARRVTPPAAASATKNASTSASVATAGSSSNKSTASASASASATSNRKRPNQQMSQQQQQQHQQNGVSVADAFNAYYMPQFALPGSHSHSYALAQAQAHHHPVHNNNNYNPWAGIGMTMPMPSNNNYNQNQNHTRTSLPGYDEFMRMHEHNINNYNNHSTYNHEGQQQQQHSPPPPPPPRNNSATADASSSTAADPDSLPQNPTESLLLSQLLLMGFEKQEILDGIRQSGNPTVDAIMLHLVSQREEAEEARREDEVRLRSEDQKQEETQRREQNEQEVLSKANTGEELLVIFPESWVLKVMMMTNKNSDDTDGNNKNNNDSNNNNRPVSTILCSESRCDFVEFLKLEEKSRKWYGWILPSDYFRKVGTRLKSVDDDGTNTNSTESCSWVDYLSIEREKLRCGLYELKEQQGGQPKLFLDERQDNGRSNGGGANEVVVIDDD